MKLDDLLLSLVVVFESRRIKGVTPLQAAAGYPRKRSHTDIVSLAAEGAMHEKNLIRSLASFIVSMVATCFW